MALDPTADASWHWWNQAQGCTTPPPSPKGGDKNLVEILPQLLDTIQNKETTPISKAHAVLSLFGLMADIHQPLNCFTKCSPNATHGDNHGAKWPLQVTVGNNTFPTSLQELWDAQGYPLKYWNWQKSMIEQNLIDSWPRGGKFKSGMYRIYTYSDVALDYVTQFVTDLVNATNPSELDIDVPKGKPWDFKFICEEGIKLSSQVYGDVEWNGDVSEEYRAMVESVTHKRLVQAGARLGRVMNKALDPKPPVSVTGVLIVSGCAVVALGLVVASVVIGKWKGVVPEQNLSPQERETKSSLLQQEEQL
eukprot:TRINITY_DN60288_c0_g1_i4.p1 TRINITY_DN60288_c0_g1~~TRINITY_DN60288_c0_g1_i4.p1  ORF type:complete len:306 (+),score=31.08 TRINITY_DN60288_c0_g1_i4:247-1164(+)